MDKEFRNLMEWKFKELKKADWSHAPFSLDPAEAAIWNRARLELMQWVLEMMPEETKDEHFN